MTVLHNPPTRNKESHHSPGHLACFIQRAQLALFKYIISLRIPVDLSYLENDFELLYFRGLIEILPRVDPSPHWLKFNPGLLALESP